MTMPSLRPHSKISIPEACAPSNMDANGIVAPASETATGQGEKQAEEVTAPPQAPATASAAATVPLRQKSSRAFKPISPGLSNISLPLGPSPKVRGGKDDASSVRIELVVRLMICHTMPQSRYVRSNCLNTNVEMFVAS